MRRARWTAILIVVLCAGGCASQQWVTLREAPRTPLSARLNLLSRGGPKPTPRTVQLLRRYALADDLEADPRELLKKLQDLIGREPEAEKLYSYAELAYLGGKKLEPTNREAALDLYGSSVAYAYLHLFDPRYANTRNAYDPQFRGACDLYNGALEGALRLVQKQGALRPGATHTINTASQTWDVTVTVRDGPWRAEDFDHIEFVSDYEVAGLTNQYRSYGLGVPLIVVRKPPEKKGAADRYYPPGLSFPMTAFLRLMPDQSAAGNTGSNHHRALLELYDPLTSTEIALADRRVPLESDLSTPLAYLLNDPALNESDLSTAGLLNAEDSNLTRGIYMLEPYQPRKIPVLMVHGVWSSPITWMEMFNDLRGSPELREHYQFWFYMYPSGQPFWHSARQLREDLAALRQTLDPARQAPALDQMVLVGHSMGGLVSKLQTIESRDDYWKLLSDQPFQMVKASPELKQGLEQTFFFNSNSGIRRVITIGTPHRGSWFANDATRWLGRKLITLPQRLVQGRDELRRENPGLFRDDTLLDVPTSIDSLAPDSPILQVMLSSPRAPWVKYHNIVGRVPVEGFKKRLHGDGDGVVEYASAHLDVVESEIVVPAEHSMVHRHPRSILEVRRILLEHLAELRAPRPLIREPRDRTAGFERLPQAVTE